MSKNLNYFQNIIDKAFKPESNVKNEFIFYLKEKLQFNDNDIYVNKEKIFTDLEESLVNDFIQKKKAGIPLDYIINSSKFYEEEFYVDQRVLIPRPETELLVDFVNSYDFPKKIKILDAGTGSGCIGISIALKNPNFDIYGSDYSLDALNVASLNKNAFKIKNFSLICSDWLSCFEEDSFDVIISNPPYITKDDKHLDNLIYEPYEALVASDGGLADIKTITEQSSKMLKEGGMLIYEHGYNQSDQVDSIFNDFGFIDSKSIKDYQGIKRISYSFLTY